MNASAIETGFDKLVRTAVREEVAIFRKELLAALASGKAVTLNGASKPNGKANGAAHHTNGASNGAVAAAAPAAKASKTTPKTAKVVAETDKINRSEFIRERPNLSVKELKAEALSLGFELKDNLIYNIRSQDRKKGAVNAAPKATKAKAVKADAAKTAPKAAKAAAPAKETKAAKAAPVKEAKAPKAAKAAAPKAKVAAPAEVKETKAAPVDKGVQNIVKVLGKETMSPPEVLGALKGAGRAPSASEPLKYVGYLLSSNVGSVFERVGKSYRVKEGGGKAEAPKAAAKAAAKAEAKAPKAAPKAAKAEAKAPAQESGRGEKSAFIRARPNDKPKDIVEAAAKEGITLTVDLVYNIRSQDKKAKEAGGGGKASAKGKTSGKAERVASNDAEPIEAQASEGSAAGDPQPDESEANAVTAVLAAAGEVESPISVETPVVKAAEPEAPAVVNGSNAQSVLEELSGDDGYANPFA